MTKEEFSSLEVLDIVGESNLDVYYTVTAVNRQEGTVMLVLTFSINNAYESLVGQGFGPYNFWAVSSIELQLSMHTVKQGKCADQALDQAEPPCKCSRSDFLHMDTCEYKKWNDARNQRLGRIL